MSNQEQQFYSSEQESPSQPSYQYYQPTSGVHSDPREGQQQEMYSEPEYYAGRGEKLQPHPPRQKRSRLLWLPLLILLLIVGLGYGFAGNHEHPDRPFSNQFGGSDYEQVIDSGITPKIIINDPSGTIHVHSNGDSSNARLVTIHMNQNRPDNNGSAPTTIFDKSSSTITVTIPQQGFGDDGYDIDITTPQASNVQLVDNNGDIHIEDVTGTVNAQTVKGSIDANDVRGHVTLSSNDGDVSLENGSLSDQSSLHSDNGDIHYDGSIEAQGNYKFDTNNGSVDVTLPGNSAFHLDAHSTNGDFTNEFGSNDVGTGTRPSLTISSENGSTHLGKN